jgi:hypothetical protein
MPKKLKRRYGTTKLHFITFSCYRRLAFLRTVRVRNAFLIVLNEVRGRYHFVIVGYVVMPEARSSADRRVGKGESFGGGAGVEAAGVAEVEGEESREVFGGTGEFVEGCRGASQFLAAAIL